MSLFSTFQQIWMKQESLIGKTPYLDPHGLGEPLDDGEEGVGGEHGGLVTLGVDDLIESVGGGGQPSRDINTLEAGPCHSSEPRWGLNLIIVKT